MDTISSNHNISTLHNNAINNNPNNNNSMDQVTQDLSSESYSNLQDTDTSNSSSSVPGTSFNDLGLDAADFPSSPLSLKQIKQFSQACVNALTKNGCISMDLVHFV